jgi:hypothetical protein
MTGSKKPEQTQSPADALAKASPEASIELSESALAEASGGAVFPSAPTKGTYSKIDSAHKINTDPALLLPAVKPAG